jgi:colanic acid/amylovoran biosynthesis glycosyltransferase
LEKKTADAKYINKMRIAFIVGKFPNLSETFVLNQITGLIDRGHDVSIIGRKPADVPTQHEQVSRYDLLRRVEYIPSFPKSKVQRIRNALALTGVIESRTHASAVLRSLQFWRYGRVAANLQLWYATCALGATKRSYDVIHAHFGPNGVLAAALRDLGLFEGAVVTTFHGADMSRYFQRAGVEQYEFLARHGEAFLPISRRWKQKLIDLGFPEERTAVHHMGVDCGAIDFSPVDLEDGAVRILSVARLTEKKGIEYALRAIGQVNGELNVQIEYTVVGDGERRAELEDLAYDLGIKSFVHFAGWKSKAEVLNLLGDAHLFLAPSVTAASGDQEGIPVAIMEAMARGLPVISTQHSGIPELVDDGNSGILVPERDVEALASALASLIQAPNRLARMGREGRRIAEEEFNIDKLNEQLVGYYEIAMDRA